LSLEHQFSSPYTPLQNGVVERKNRTLCEMARTMLDEHRTSRRFSIPQSIQEKKPIMSWCTVAHPRWVTSMCLVASALSLRKVLTVNSCIKVRLDLQADKSSVIVKGPFFPRVVNPRHRIRGTNVWHKTWSSKAKKHQSSRGETLMHLIQEHQKPI
jgi:hypothetical protein